MGRVAPWHRELARRRQDDPGDHGSWIGIDLTFDCMKVPTQTVKDTNGNDQAVLVALEDWNELVGKLRHYEQLLNLKSKLSSALDQVARMRSGKLKKRTLKDALRGA